MAASGELQTGWVPGRLGNKASWRPRSGTQNRRWLGAASVLYLGYDVLNAPAQPNALQQDNQQYGHGKSPA